MNQEQIRAKYRRYLAWAESAQASSIWSTFIAAAGHQAAANVPVAYNCPQPDRQR